jgi:glycosyltransferase involved in cell wall biosynthesis
MTRPRVLLVAEAANPEWASVPLVGWSLCRALREHADAHVVTQIRNRDAMERAGWREGREFTAIDSEAVARPVYLAGEAIRRWTGAGWTVTTAFASVFYYHFERLLWGRFGDAIRGGAYDLVHRVTPLSPTTPSLLARHCRRAGVPFVWGPLNGGVPWPREFRDRLRHEGEWLSYVRGAYRLLPGYRSTRDAAAATITGSIATWAQMARWRDRCVYVPENAIDPARFPDAPPPELPPRPLRVAFVGRLVPYKGADMLLEAAAPLVREGRVVVDVIGDGPQMPALRAQVAAAGLGAGVALDGWVDHRDLAERLRRAHVFGFPSVREFGGGVVLEAMALGLAPVVVDYAGPAELVTPTTGFRVPIGSREEVVARFRAILAELADHPERAREIGARARRRVRDWYTWDAKARQIVEIYRWVLGAGQRPDFGMPFPDAPGPDAAAGDAGPATGLADAP